MSVTESFFQHWYFHVPNLLLAAMIYTLIARYVLALFFKPDSQMVIWRTFATITDPILHAVRAVTPRVVQDGLIPVAAIVWLMALRMFLYLTVLAAGVKLATGA
jgi:YggT family protein